MPRGDGTGPGGMGPMTGRAAGYCAGFNTPGFANPVRGGFGRGYGRGGGMGFGGRGWRHWFCATGLPGWLRFGGAGMMPQGPDPEVEKQALRGQVDALRAELDALQKRLNELEGDEDSQ